MFSGDTGFIMILIALGTFVLGILGGINAFRGTNDSRLEKIIKGQEILLQEWVEKSKAIQKELDDEKEHSAKLEKRCDYLERWKSEVEKTLKQHDIDVPQIPAEEDGYAL